MAGRMKLVQGDTKPPVTVQLTQLTNPVSGAVGPVDLSDAGLVVRMKFREEGTDTVLATLLGTKLTGYDPGTGVVNQNAPYNVAGFGGRVQFSWIGTTLLDSEAGNYEGEIYLTYGDGSIQTGWDLLKFSIREDF